MSINTLMDLEKQQNLFSVKLSDCIGLTGGVDAVIKVQTMEGYCKALKEEDSFIYPLYELLHKEVDANPEMVKYSSGTEADVTKIKDETLRKYEQPEMGPKEKIRYRKTTILQMLLDMLRYVCVPIQDLVLVDLETVKIVYISGETKLVSIQMNPGMSMIRNILLYI